VNPIKGFFQPAGLTIYKELLYFCEYHLNCVQVVTKDTGTFVTQWGRRGKGFGQFNDPVSIYHDTLEFFYIGDWGHVHVWTLDGKCIARLGDKSGEKMNQFSLIVSGICEVNDNLYFSDLDNHRILIFKRK